MPSLIALLGLRDGPTDGVADYCEFLSRALSKQGVEVQTARVPWDEIGWPHALWHLFRESAAWRGKWVVLQYTAMGWSRRGFPVGALVAVAILRLRGARCAILFHEPSGASGTRLTDRIRCAFQDWTVRTLHRVTEKSVFTVPLDAFPWLSTRPDAPLSFRWVRIFPKISPIGPRRLSTANLRKTVVVFCVSDPPHQQREIREICPCCARRSRRWNSVACHFRRPRYFRSKRGN